MNHVEQYLSNRTKYLQGINEQLAAQPQSLSKNTKVTVILILLSASEYTFLESIHAHIDLPEIEKACRILDAARLCRQLKKKSMSLRRIGKIKNILMDIRRLELLQDIYDYRPLRATLTKRRRQEVMKWTKSISPDQLQFRAYFFKADLWRSLADMCHLNPRRDFQLDWFLGYCFGKPAPVGSLLRQLQDKDRSFDTYYSLSKVPYECIHATKFQLSTRNKEDIIQHENIETIRKYWAELSCAIGKEILTARTLHLTQ